MHQTVISRARRYEWGTPNQNYYAMKRASTWFCFRIYLWYGGVENFIKSPFSVDSYDRTKLHRATLSRLRSLSIA